MAGAFEMPHRLCPHTPPAQVGLFWRVGEAAGPAVLVSVGIGLDAAEPYGAFLGHPGGHCDIWEGWRRLGVGGLLRQGLPACIASHEYEDFPRGRIVYHCPTRSFTVYIDRRLNAPAQRRAIVSRFGLSAQTVRFAFDPHYRTARRSAEGW